MSAEDSSSHWIRVGDRRVRRLGLGTNRVTLSPEGRAILHRAIELGVNFIDTADIYQSGSSEEAIGNVVPPSMTDVLVATKGGMIRTGEGLGTDARPEHLKTAFEDSLRRLHRDRIDLYQLHRVDPRAPIEDSLGVLRDLQRDGRIRHIGVSNVSLSELERARKVVVVVSVQNRYNLLERDGEDVLQYCAAHGIPFIPWFPLHRGSLASDPTLSRIAKEREATPPQVALAWLLQRSPVMLPIPGTLSEKHLEENLAATGLELDVDEIRQLDALIDQSAKTPS
ncbi:MAG TPA: aldo/keto reductase [Thermoplasmata archaeon]|nr:aldo/keto reductase [Thermoplasmata archaeon]